jgi:hypothetical protein
MSFLGGVRRLISLHEASLFRAQTMPDLMDPVPETGKLRFNSKSAGKGSQQAGSARPAARSGGNKPASALLQPELPAVLSATLRIELLRKIDGLNSAEEAALWAQR